MPRVETRKLQHSLFFLPWRAIDTANQIANFQIALSRAPGGVLIFLQRALASQSSA